MEIAEIKNIFKEIDNNLNKKINLIISNKSKWNELTKYDYGNNLSFYDFFIDENKFINYNKVPNYNCLLNDNIIQKIKQNYKDDFI